MKGQTAYITYKGLEEVFLLDEDHPELYRILLNHSDVMIDLTDQEFDEKQEEDVFLRSLVKREGFYCFALTDFFQNLDDFVFADCPRDLFILDKRPEACAQLRAEQGVFILSDQNLKEADIFSTQFEKSLYKGEVAQGVDSNGNRCVGWVELLKPLTIQPFNSIIICDNYLFDNQQQGMDNVVSLLQAIMPKALKVPFHILIITYNKTKDNGRQNITPTDAQAIINTLIANLSGFGCSIELSFLTHKRKDEFHKRTIITNYHRIKSEHGFAAFNGHKVNMETDFDVHSVYHRILDPASDLALKSILELLKRTQHCYTETINAGNLPSIPTDLHVGHKSHRLLQ